MNEKHCYTRLESCYCSTLSNYTTRLSRVRLGELGHFLLFGLLRNFCSEKKNFLGYDLPRAIGYLYRKYCKNRVITNISKTRFKNDLHLSQLSHLHGRVEPCRWESWDSAVLDVLRSKLKVFKTFSQTIETKNIFYCVLKTKNF